MTRARGTAGPADAWDRGDPRDRVDPVTHRPVPAHLSPAEGARELVRIEAALADTRRRLAADPETRFRRPRSVALPGVLRIGFLVAVAFFAVLVAVAGAVDGPRVLVPVGSAVAVVSLVVVVRLVRRLALPAARARGATARAALSRQRELLARLDEVHAALGGHEPDASAWPDTWLLALPPSRQPRAWAQVVHGRFGVGEPPDVRLRRLPSGAAPVRVWFHRTIGPSGVVAVLLGLVVLAGLALYVASWW